jgi:hypothetical protein
LFGTFLYDKGRCNAEFTPANAGDPTGEIYYHDYLLPPFSLWNCHPGVLSSWKIFLKEKFIQDLDYGRNIHTIGEILGSNPHYIRISPRMTATHDAVLKQVQHDINHVLNETKQGQQNNSANKKPFP